jgi:putative ABC transport system permease protein
MAEAGIALIILLAACFNYTNLSIARSLKRGKEVGVRKVSGAMRVQVFTQFITESLLTAFLSLLLACIFLKLMTDYAPFAQEMVPPGVQPDIKLVAWFVLFSLFTGLLAGAIPAWALSSFKATDVLKNLLNVRLFGGNTFRKSLTVAQFALSLVITIFTLTFARQFQYMATADPGFRKENIVTIPIQKADYRLLTHDIRQLSGVKDVFAVSDNPGRSPSGSAFVKLQPAATPIRTDYFDVDASFIKGMDLTLIAGQAFPGQPTSREQYIVLNENAVKALKFKSAAEAIGKIVWLDDNTQVQITGVVKDFYYMGLHFTYSPMLLRNRPENFRLLDIITNGKPSPALLQQAEAAWAQYNPRQEFTWSSLDEELYRRDSAGATVSMLGFLTLMAIVIACLGLTGMAIYNIETRRKEIGIRKVMGAQVGTLMALLSRAYIKLVIIAGAIALPVSIVLTWFFLSIFPNRVSLGLAIPLYSFLAILVLVAMSIGTQIYRAAVDNPVKSLRTE